MYFTTTKCPHCWYRTRNRLSHVPLVDLGQPIHCCPMCDNLIIDSIITEYEFMSDKEQKKFSEAKWIYESLLRTSNETYLNLLKRLYENKREYNPIPNRLERIKEFKQYSNEDFHNECEKDFFVVLKLIENQNDEIKIKEVVQSDFFNYAHNGGFILSLIFALPSIFVGIKQKIALARKIRLKDAVEKPQQDKKVNRKNLKANNKMQLTQLKELYDEGLITESEFDEKRKKILEKF